MATKSKRILIVEDDKFLSRAMSDKLKRAGFEIDVAFDGEQGMELMKKNKPALVLLDLVMPRMNGFEFMEAKNAKKVYKKIPVLILSNLGQFSDIERGKELGAAGYLVKADFSLKEVLARVKRTIK